MIGFDRRVFQCAVHAFNLTVRPGMPERGEAMVNAKRGAGGIEGMRFAFGAAVRQQEFISELWPIVGQHRVDFVRHGFGQMIEERCRDNNGRRAVNLGEDELAGAVNRDIQVSLAIAGARLADIDVKIANGIVLELLFGTVFPWRFRQNRQAIAL